MNVTRTFSGYESQTSDSYREKYKCLIFHNKIMEKEKKINLKDIPQDSCKIFDLDDTRVAVCHESTGEFSFFELKPIQPIHTYIAGAKSSDTPKTFVFEAGAVDKGMEQ